MGFVDHKVRGGKYIVAATLFTVLVLVSYAAQLSVPVISDETVTMANAAWVTGRDWSLMIAHLGGLYYRFAQALMSVPLFLWLDDPALIYRGSMILQAVVYSSIVPVVYIICRRHLKMQSPLIASMAGVLVCFVPSAALYVLYYRGDYLLYVLPWYVLLFFLETVRAARERQRIRRAGYTLAAAFCCSLAYMAHTRGIVLTIALLLSWIFFRIWKHQKSLNGIVYLLSAFFLEMMDYGVGGALKQALYSVSGVNANAFESVDMSAYFNLFSLPVLKSLALLCLGWLNTLIVTTHGLVLIGCFAAGVVLFRAAVSGKRTRMAEQTAGEGVSFSLEEIITVLFSVLIFLGFYAVGALYFKDVYALMRSGSLTRRSDRLLYDRYSVCGAGMPVFLALYALCTRREWLGRKAKILCITVAIAVFGIFLWKLLPVVTEYTGYIYNTISLNTFQTIEDPAAILSGASYGKTALIGACVLGLGLLAAVLVLSSVKKKRMPYILLLLVFAGNLTLIHTNYVKIRKASNDYVQEATADVVSFLQAMEDDISEEYPYILKGGLSGVKIQFYQSQLMDYRLFGKKQEQELGLTDYFIISKNGNINLTWYEDDYYLFEAFDYENAEYDIVYVKGDALADRLEKLGYTMIRYVPENQE
ncbi:MAG: hypothetical protein LUD18_15120 [Lachnospiraceae bacterium]|nr:hypothetical protein [Lachnospiraceae bacterium]